MPLSKARDRERKAEERAKSRLEKLLCPPQTSKSVQPNDTLRQPSPLRAVVTRASGGAYEEPLEYEVGSPAIDADGNPIYES